MLFIERCKCIWVVFIASEVSFIFPVTRLRLVVFWVLHPAAASTKVDSKENSSKSRAPSSSGFLFIPILTLKHLHTHTTTTQMHINHQSETCTY